jgi:copper chaperone CopZ
MKTISVPDMMCTHCVERITDGLTAAGLSFTVSLEKKTVELDGGEAQLKTAMGELEDLGFTPKADGKS